MGDVGRRSRRFRRPRPGEEVDLWLRSELADELAPPEAAACVDKLRADGVDRLRVTVVKSPGAELLGAEDAVKVQAPELAADPRDPAVYVRLAFLDLPPI
jgi:hypothetical protein